MTNCGPGGFGSESCCSSPEVTSGTFYRTYENDGGGPAGEADPATVSTFRLDKYEVTVGRFRQFVDAVLPRDGGAGWLPPAGSGKHAHLNGGLGLVDVGVEGGVVYETGWLGSYDGNIAPTSQNLTCHDGIGGASWTGGDDNRPMNCVNWWEAYAFCIWDGGFLPSEAEWEYAAAGGSQQREYPWGATDPGTRNEYAIYGGWGDGGVVVCNYPAFGLCAGVTNIARVGTPSLGAGLWGQLDLAGNMGEWILDAHEARYVDPCADCSVPVGRLSGWYFPIGRSGSFADGPGWLSPTARIGWGPTDRISTLGLRCARSP
jgi:formylglycine-generating enzyme required for sulfatase activity